MVTGSSSAFGESVSLTVSALPSLAVAAAIPAPALPLVAITSGPLPTASGSAPAPYDVTQTVLSASVAGALSTGVLTAAASSNVDGLPGSRTTNGTGTVNGLVVGLPGLLSLTATTLQASATVAGDYGALTGTGSTIITGLTLNGLAIAVGSTPNDVILDAGGIVVTLNKQVASGDGVTSKSETVDAIDITFTAVPDLVGLVPGLLNGEIIIASGTASQTARPDGTTAPVPEPVSAAMLGASFAALAAVRRRRS